MLEVVTDRGKIRMVREELMKRLEPFITDEVRTSVTYQGGADEVTVFWSDHLGLWWHWGEGSSQYWHPFHVQKPKARTEILVEVNFPIEGFNPRIAGVVLRDTRSQEYVVAHSGRIGGGRRGIGLSLMRQQLGDASFPLMALTPNGERSYMSVALVDAPNAAQQLAAFVKTVDFVKHGTVTPAPDHSSGYRQFQLEFEGETAYQAPSLVTAQYNHGAVVNQLAATLSDLGMSVHNDRPRDLFIVKHNAVAVLFEVKTDISPQTIYTAVGQLLLNSDPTKRPVLCLVVPASEHRSHLDRVLALGIHLVEYTINATGMIAFSGLEPVLATADGTAIL